eukprot:232267_1
MLVSREWTYNPYFKRQLAKNIRFNNQKPKPTKDKKFKKNGKIRISNMLEKYSILCLKRYYFVLLILLIIATFINLFLWEKLEYPIMNKLSMLSIYGGSGFNKYRYRDCSCLNKIYNAIYVISIRGRQSKLSITSFQLNNENINFTFWEGHNEQNSYSMLLWNIFKNKINQTIDEYLNRNNNNISIDAERIYDDMKQIKYENSAYYNKHVFFLRQTQIDIIKYSLLKNYSKILIFEDDILLSDPKYINMFCEYENRIPEWYILGLGINQYNRSVKLINVADGDIELKYYIRNEHSMGAFAISISSKMFQILINLFDFDEKHNDLKYNTHSIIAQRMKDKNKNNQNLLNLYPLDNYFRFIQNNMYVKNHCFNIHPTLVLPDVTDSMLRSSRNQLDFIKKHTIDRNLSHFSKYWNVRFFSKHFDDLANHSPSNLYLYKNKVF